ncbi:MAG: YebC/PmpR family DNA-binding transcriptional regulator [Rhodobiaceae bacterium]|jgi:YebC/PmpR family DNA-binding regulatory protein|nr:YebC/PmpR family DNA-binding transcriptional regulator [Rhodobiaceae bacterium]MBT5640845.1 YebC/PmpR family DNA-binding transcriptional regulator [Rhodobiaceae bacterium]MBT6222528.1 YebC/PmpR family DNA-binding transcriptional regulator [Rhodobiaceae bacterium]MDB4832030.1 YebC/PmpR family DNA-binding transcriptional regulator [Hyphomicrobiales bacterium]MDC3272278.1 YebC/PmpR family DNA-binding transcriptional regulator [Hyphomicrobiales bacterium]
MSGHSQFSNIMHRKGAQDKKRAKIFSKLAKEITVAAKAGLPDPDMNPRLRSAVQAARSQNMPKDNIERAIKKSQDNDLANYDEVRYEGFGPGGIGFIVETLTDNRNRTAGEVRSIFTKCGGNLGETGSVSFSFKRVGLIEFPKNSGSDDDLIEMTIEAGAEDCISNEDTHEIYCKADELHSISAGLENQLGEPNSVSIIWKPETLIPADIELMEKIIKMIDALEDSDDIQNVYTNFDATDEVLEQLSG